jgi:hypothetical protein
VVAEAAGWRGIDELAALVGHYAWLEARLFELTGRWASAPVGDGAAPDGRADELRVWCAAASRRHGELAAHWAQRLPVRAGVDAGALVVAPSGALAEALDALEAEAELTDGVAALVGTVLPRVVEAYRRHAAAALPVSEAPVLEVLMEARRAVEGEIRGGGSLLEKAWPEALVSARTIVTILSQAFEEMCVLPAVHPS